MALKQETKRVRRIKDQQTIIEAKQKKKETTPPHFECNVLTNYIINVPYRQVEYDVLTLIAMPETIGSSPKVFYVSLQPVQKL